jgi:LAO/AO transport system kinase
VPGLGDDVQAIKAGVLEIADVFAVNKADREGADRTVRDLQTMLELRRTVLGRPVPDHDEHHLPSEATHAPHVLSGSPDLGWEPPIVRTVAVKGEGVEDLAAGIEAHRAHLERTGGRRVREAARARAGFVTLLRERLLSGALARLEAETGRLDEVAARIAAREADPWALAEEIAVRLRA